MIVVPFEPWHLEELRLQPSQVEFQPVLTDSGYGRMLKNGGPAFAGKVDGKVVACLGIIPQWENRAIAWGLVGVAAGPVYLSIHRAVKRFLDFQDYARIEMAVTTDFSEGHRWARMLGFEREGTMRAYTPSGGDCDLYARLKCKR